jgi:hypothetical protein
MCRNLAFLLRGPTETSQLAVVGTAQAGLSGTNRPRSVRAPGTASILKMAIFPELAFAT